MEEEKRKALKFVDAGSNNWNERRELSHKMDRHRRMEEDNKTLGAERCKKIIFFR